MKKYRLAIIYWEDALNRQSWHTEEELDEFVTDKGFECENVGWIVRETKNAVFIASRKGDVHEQYGLIQRIPRGMVKKVKYL